jgi:hypothetical protein
MKLKGCVCESYLIDTFSRRFFGVYERRWLLSLVYTQDQRGDSATWYFGGCQVALEGFSLYIYLSLYVHEIGDVVYCWSMDGYLKLGRRQRRIERLHIHS